MAGTLMHEAGVPLKRAHEILGHASDRTILSIYTHSMRRTHDDSADKIAVLAGLSPIIVGNIWKTNSSVEHEKVEINCCFYSYHGRIIRARAHPSGRPAGDRRRCAASSNRLVYVGGSNYGRLVRERGVNSNFFKNWLPGTDCSRLRRESSAALRTAAAKRVGVQLGLWPSCRTVLFSVGGSNFGRQASVAKDRYLGQKEVGSPGRIRTADQRINSPKKRVQRHPAPSPYIS